MNVYRSHKAFARVMLKVKKIEFKSSQYKKLLESACQRSLVTYSLSAGGWCPPGVLVSVTEMTVQFFDTLGGGGADYRIIQ
jgi:hypothetical protein